MDVEVVEREPMIVVGWQARFVPIMSPNANNSSVIGDLWTKTFQYDVVSKLPGSLGHPTWGVIWKPADSGEELDYLAGVPFSSMPELPEGMSAREVPGGRFAKITHKGPLSGLKETIAGLHKWIEDNGYVEPANWHDLELYDERFFEPGPEQAFDYFASIDAV
ncbi:MAG: GyrI-like domain-containing protein [Planctomycetes bacterium]|nr:GyrI-like domain-containing protein [Planctomycetota bacterium]